MTASVARTGPGTRAAPAANTASPRTAYSPAHTMSRLAPAACHPPGANRYSSSATTQPQTIWSLNPNAVNGRGGGPMGRLAMR